MSTNPDEVLVKRSDLLPVDDCGDYYLVDNTRYYKTIRYYKTEGPTATRAAAMRFLSAAIRMEDDAAAKAKQEAKEWELEHAVPLARTLYNAYHTSSDPWHTEVDEDMWLNNYKAKNHAAVRWVGVAATALKSLGANDNG